MHLSNRALSRIKQPWKNCKKKWADPYDHQRQRRLSEQLVKEAEKINEDTLNFNNTLHQLDLASIALQPTTGCTLPRCAWRFIMINHILVDMTPGNLRRFKSYRKGSLTTKELNKKQ